MTTSLPPDANLSWLRKAAKALRTRVRTGDAEATALVRATHPRPEDVLADPSGFTLSAAQLTIARNYGFASWPRLAVHIAGVATLTRSPHRDAEAPGDSAAAELLRLGCLTFGAGDTAARIDRGAALLAAAPHLGAANAYTSAATGEHAALAALLAADPDAAAREGGPFGWPPLLYLAYSRLSSPSPAADPVEAARVLLRAGADPNAGFLWSGLVPPFTVVTGVIGRGEHDAPAHREQLALLALLLEAGADANDGQAAYNAGLGNARPADDTDWLELLLGHGFGHPGDGPWYARFGGLLAEPAALAGELLQDAAGRGLTRRVRVLLAAGVDPERGGTHPRQRGSSPYADAVAHGYPRIAALLELAGAATAATSAADRAAGRALAGEPLTAEEAATAQRRRPDLVRLAAELGKPPGVIEGLVALGWDVNARQRATALHEAALRGDAGLVRALLALGADPALTDTEFGATAAGWAAYAGHADVQRLLEGAG